MSEFGDSTELPADIGEFGFADLSNQSSRSLPAAKTESSAADRVELEPTRNVSGKLGKSSRPPSSLTTVAGNSRPPTSPKQPGGASRSRPPTSPKQPEAGKSRMPISPKQPEGASKSRPASGSTASTKIPDTSVISGTRPNTSSKPALASLTRPNTSSNPAEKVNILRLDTPVGRQALCPATMGDEHHFLEKGKCKNCNGTRPPSARCDTPAGGQLVCPATMGQEHKFLENGKCKNCACTRPPTALNSHRPATGSSSNYGDEEFISSPGTSRSNVAPLSPVSPASDAGSNGRRRLKVSSPGTGVQG
jgi:hypothetical protein